MQLTIDLTGRDVLVTGSEKSARQAVRRYQSAGANVYRLSAPEGVPGDGQLPERPFLVAVVDDGGSGWLPLVERCRDAGIPVAFEPAPGAEGQVTLVGGGPGAWICSRWVLWTPCAMPMWCSTIGLLPIRNWLI